MSPQTLRDRVAEAIYEVDPHYWGPGSPESDHFVPWAELSEDYRPVYFEFADEAVRVCLRAMQDALVEQRLRDGWRGWVAAANFVEREFADGALKDA